MHPTELPEHQTLFLNSASRGKRAETWYTEGEWISYPEFVEHTGTSAGDFEDFIFLRFTAKEVNAKMSSPRPTAVHVKFDGKRYRDAEIHEAKFYNVFSSEQSVRGELKIFVKDKGVRAYAFTFGGCLEK